MVRGPIEIVIFSMFFLGIFHNRDSAHNVLMHPVRVQVLQHQWHYQDT